ncbi:MAG: zinc-dependent metalloprotease [Planctomyces sp.]|nr:zinc-dependent metalloprotease [Planctomyces sp.]
MLRRFFGRRAAGVLAAAACTLSTVAFSSAAVQAQDAPAQPGSDYPPHAKVLEGFEKVVNKANIRPMYTLWTRQKDGQVFAELPRTFAQKKYFFAMTVASGEDYAGLQAGDLYAYWRQYDKRLALISPNISIRANGDKEAESSVKRLFTDRVLLDVPIVTMGPGGGPVIDLDAMLLNNATTFFGGSGSLNFGLTRGGIYSISTAKAFENNVEVAFQAPDNGGILKTLHYSISDIPDSTGYQPRVADTRIGYFTTSYTDLAKYDDRETSVRYINRWFLEKADPKLQVSPPKNPIVFYIEHTTPVRYRRWVREGVLAWNQAFEKVGISNAIEVYYQDAASQAHMDKDPEDVNYNFVRWLNNNVGTAIGPSRVHPMTGQILDADIILTDGWIRHYQQQFSESLPKLAMEGYGPDTLAWLAEHPEWDPRIRLAPPSMRNVLSEKIAQQAALPYAGHPMSTTDSKMMGDQEFDGLFGRTSQVNGLCLAADGLSFDMAVMRMTMEILAQETPAQPPAAEGEKKEEKKEEKPKEQMLDGMPESFVGPLIAHLVAHEVGHTMGLRHNFKASSIFTLAQINSEEVKGKKQLAGSVMDYIGTNIRLDSGTTQGDYCMTGIGPYDMWAIEYGYTFGDTKPVLARVAEPELVYATDEDTGGPDPLARRYDFTKNPLDYAEEQYRLAAHHRARLLSEFIKDGESWDRVRYGYEMILSLQVRSLSMVANWVGGAHVNRDKKGDPNGRKPIDVVPAEQQRRALNFVVNNAFRDEAFGLSPELVVAMGLDKWEDVPGSMFEDATWPIHDRIMGIQASALTSLMNPTTLKRVYDNEFRVPADQDSLTLPELLTTVSTGVWAELDAKAEGAYTARKPLISSLRRNLQREHLERLIDLTLPGNAQGAAGRAISSLASDQLRQIVKKIEAAQAAAADRHDPYTSAHLAQARDRITKALDADYILNPSRGAAGGGGTRIIIGNAPAQLGNPIQEQTFPVTPASEVQPNRAPADSAPAGEGQK